MNEVTQRKINKLRRDLQSLSNASKQPDQKAALMRFMVKRALDLKNDRDRLHERLNAGWDYLDGMDEDDPEYTVNETRLIDWLHEYEAICDVLEDAEVRHAGVAA